jgi:hypothetical protein
LQIAQRTVAEHVAQESRYDAPNTRSSPPRPRQIASSTGASPAIMHHPDALSQGDAAPLASAPRLPGRSPPPPSKSSTPATCSTDAVAGIVPDVHAEGEVRLGFQDKSHSTCPGPLLFIPHVVASRSLPDFCEPCLPSSARQAPRWGRVAARNQTRRLPNARAPRAQPQTRASL